VIRDGRYAAIVALVLAACALLAALALAPSAGATLKASVDAGGLVLTDADGTPDDVTLSTNKAGLFVALDDHNDALGPVCPLVSPKFHGFQCELAPLVRIDAGAGDDRIDATRLTTPLQATLGPGSDVLEAGSANDTIATVADGRRDVVDCGGGQDVVDGLADPNDELAATCETAQRSFAPAKLPKALTVSPTSTVTVAIGRADVPLGFVATLATAPPKGSTKKGTSIASTTVARGTGPVKLRFKLARLSTGFLSRRPDVRVQIDVTAIAADGRRYPLSLHSRSPGSRPETIGLHDNQLRLKIPARLRHPHGH
jgi:Ca2+-binding RTX toxin-like protein